jgi:hypothetical protein
MTKQTFGSRAEVYHGTALKTTGGLRKADLMKNKHGRIVSRKKFVTAKKEKRLLKYGYSAKKGKFGYVRVDAKKSRGRKSKRGGAALGGPLSPSAISGIGKTSGVDVQLLSTNY